MNFTGEEHRSNLNNALQQGSKRKSQLIGVNSRKQSMRDNKEAYNAILIRGKSFNMTNKSCAKSITSDRLSWTLKTIFKVQGYHCVLPK